MSTTKSQIQAFTESSGLDVFGVAIVISVSLTLGFHKTVIDELPIGLMSVVGATFSMLATRLVTKRNNIGNLIGIAATINSAIVDYYLGNQAAFLTYPISFFGLIASYLFWKKKGNRTPRRFDRWYFINVMIAFSLAFVLNYIGFTGYLNHDIMPEDKLKFWITAIITGLTFSGTLNMPRMYADTWAFYEVYNGLKIYQNILFGNTAYVAKYIFYLFNALLGWIVWHQVRRKETSLD
jgi:nicotinamide riboside transporter PnuC